MRLRHFALALESEDFQIKNPDGSDFPYSASPIVSDFRFYTEFFNDYMSRGLRKLGIETGEFNMIIIRGVTGQADVPRVSNDSKTLVVEVPFETKTYHAHFPRENKYPLEGKVSPVTDSLKWSEFLMEMAMKGILKCEEFLPSEAISDLLLDFKSDGFVNRRVVHSRTSRRHKIKANLIQLFECDVFSLLLELEKHGTLIDTETVLTTIPSRQIFGAKHSIEIDQNKLSVVDGNGTLLSQKVLPIE